MTPTERAAVAEAIAALEHLKKFLGGLSQEYARYERISDASEVFRDNIWFIDNTLASLRAVAPMPEAAIREGGWQDIASAPRDGTVIMVFADTDCSEEKKRRLARWATPVGHDGEWWEDESDCTISDPACWTPVLAEPDDTTSIPSHTLKSAAPSPRQGNELPVDGISLLDEVLWHTRQILHYGSDADLEAFGAVMFKRHEELLAALAPASADQSDAGRDEVIEVLRELIAEHDKPIVPLNMKDHPFGVTMKIPSDEQIASMGLWARARALASAPSETVGRGEEALTQNQRASRIHNEEFPTWWNREARKGNPGLEFRTNRENAFRAGVDAAVRSALPTTDRDAIQEALKEAKNWIERCDDATDAILLDKSDMVEQLTTTLALLEKEPKP